jgi:glycosyltransferase involved in cell wall biosynthesis
LKKKVAYLAFGHFDVSLHTVNALSEHYDVTFVMIFSRNRLHESIIDIRHSHPQTGFSDETQIATMIGAKVFNSISTKIVVKLFVFDTWIAKKRDNWRRTKELLRSVKDHAILHISGHPGLMPLLLLYSIGQKKVFTIHDFVGHSGEQKTKAHIINKLLIRLGYKVILQNKNDYQTLKNKYKVSDSKLRFIPFGPLNIYNGLGSEREESSIDVLFFGRFSPYKGIPYLITAVKQLYDQKYSFRTVIAGPGPVDFDQNDLQNYPDIEILNTYLSNARLASLISASKMVVCPYTDATQSGVVMTAFAFNKPVIATKVGGLSEVVSEGKTGYLVPPKDASCLAEKIRHLLTHEYTLELMRENIKLYKQDSDYSWHAIGEAHRSFYEGEPI